MKYRELCITEYVSSTRVGLAGMVKNPYVAATSPTPESVADACCRNPDQRARIYRFRAVLRPETDGRGRLWPCPRPRRNLRLPGAALVRPLLFRAEGRERQDRGSDLEIRPRPDALQAAGGAGGHRYRQAHDLSGLVEIP